MALSAQEALVEAKMRRHLIDAMIPKYRATLRPGDPKLKLSDAALRIELVPELDKDLQLVLGDWDLSDASKKLVTEMQPRPDAAGQVSSCGARRPVMPGLISKSSEARSSAGSLGLY